MSALISVIIPAYNVELYLDACVESVLNQTYRNIEVIIVNDGSTDRTAQLCDMWAQRDNRIHVIHQSNQGLSAARNNAINYAKGAYLCFVDSDDYVSDSLCQTVMECAEVYDPDIIRFKHSIANDSGVLLPQDTNEPGMIKSIEAVRRLLLGTMGDYAWDKVYKRDVFREIRYPAGRLFEDIGTTYRLFLAAEKIYCIDDCLYYYRAREGSITNHVNSRALCDLFEMRMQRYAYLSEHYPDIASLDLITRAIVAQSLVTLSWLENVDETSTRKAKAFLKENREVLLRTTIGIGMRCFLLIPHLYRLYRVLRYRFGRWLRIRRHAMLAKRDTGL